VSAKIHADEVATDASLVRRLAAAQFPQWADLPVTPVDSAGTDNAIYRLGTRMAMRLPRIDWAAGQPGSRAAGQPGSRRRSICGYRGLPSTCRCGSRDRSR
jgi:hypothetical protein